MFKTLMLIDFFLLQSLSYAEQTLSSYLELSPVVNLSLEDLQTKPFTVIYPFSYLEKQHPLKLTFSYYNLLNTNSNNCYGVYLEISMENASIKRKEDFEEKKEQTSSENGVCISFTETCLFNLADYGSSLENNKLPDFLISVKDMDSPIHLKINVGEGLGQGSHYEIENTGDSRLWCFDGAHFYKDEKYNVNF
jgi:hypothetical protein